MSTTTTRGVLWEMVGPVLRWPMRSRTRFFGLLALVVVIVWLISKATGDTSTTTQQAPSQAAATAAPSAASMATAAPTPTQSPQAAQTGAEGSQGGSSLTPAQLASRFVAAWAHPKLSQAQWWAGVSAADPDEGFAQALSQTDPSTIPASKVIGKPQVIAASSSLVRVKVRTNGPAVIVVLTPGEVGGWTVSNILPARLAERRGRSRLGVGGSR